MIVRTGITSRPSRDSRDYAMMYDMIAASPHNALHAVDLPWRLSSPSARTTEWTQIWESADGTGLAWAVLQFPWHCLDYEIRPDTRSDELEESILDWAVTRLNAEASRRGESLPFYVSARQGDSSRVAAIARAGFSFDEWSYLHMARSLGTPIPDAPLPKGFHIRPLAGDEEVGDYVAAHRAAFGSTNMTADWRRATLRDPHHVPDLDLVAVGPDGAIVAFCVCWITPPFADRTGGRVTQIEPLGVLPEYQRLGLGRALLLEAFRRSKDMGAFRVEVDGESYNAASQRAYESVGFRAVYEAPFFLRSFG